MNWFNHAEWKRGVVQIEFRRYFKYVSSPTPPPSAQPGNFPVSLVIEITPLATVCQLRCKGGHESTFNTLPHSSPPRNTWGRRNFFSISSPWLLLPHSWQWIVFSIHASMPVEWSIRFGGWLMVKEWTVLRSRVMAANQPPNHCQTCGIFLWVPCSSIPSPRAVRPDRMPAVHKPVPLASRLRSKMILAFLVAEKFSTAN